MATLIIESSDPKNVKLLTELAPEPSMNLKFDKSFLKSIEKVKDASLKMRH